MGTLSLRLEPATDADFRWLLGEQEPSGNLRVAPELVSADVLRIIRKLPANWLMIFGDELVGIISLKTQSGNHVEIGYGVAASREGRGFASAALAALLPTLRQRGVSAVFAETSVHNPASQRVLAKNGFAAFDERVDDEDGLLICWRRDL